MINEADLRELSAAERRQLARSLAAIDYPDPLLEVTLARGRKLGALFSIVACTVLVGWIIVLLFTLHRSFHAHYWRLAWVGFDIVLLFGFAATGWAFWRGRQIVIACLLVTGTLLCCDAWFDVMLDLGTQRAVGEHRVRAGGRAADRVPDVRRGPAADPAVRARGRERIGGRRAAPVPVANGPGRGPGGRTRR